MPDTLLALDGELNIYRAQALREPLLALLAQDAPLLTIDLSGVSEIDSAGVQLLMAAKRQAQATDRRLVLVGHSPSVIDAFALLDLTGWFGDPVVEPAAG